MKALAVAALDGLGAAPAIGDPVLGVWKARPDDNGNFGHVRMYDCDGRICGVITRAFDGSGAQIDSENIGKRWIWAMIAQGEGEYGEGRIGRPTVTRSTAPG